MSEHRSEDAAARRRRIVAQAVCDGLVDAGDGSYVTSFDTDETAQVVIDRVTERVLDILEDMGPSPAGRLYCLTDIGSRGGAE